MSDLKSLWASATVDQGYKDFVDGDYVAVLDEAALDLTKEPARATFKLKIAKGDYEGRLVWQNLPLDLTKADHWGVPALKRVLVSLGRNPDPDKLEDLADDLVAVTGMTVKIKIKRNPSKTDPTKVYDNANIQGLWNAADAVEGTGSVATEVDSNDELPF